MTDEDRLLGKLLAEAEASQRQREEIFDQLREIRKTMVHKKDFDDHVKFAEETTLDYKVTKARLYGMIIAFSAVAAGLWELFRSIF